MLRKILAEFLEGAAKKVKPKTLIEKGKEIGIDVEKLKLGDKSLIKKVLKELGFKPKTGIGSSLIKGGAAAGAGSAATLGAQKFTGDVKEELEKSRMAGGGMVKKRAKTRTKVSRGTGAAIRGKKFKGVF